MDSLQRSINFWVTVLGTLVGLFGLIQSQPWLITIGALAVAGSVAALLYAGRERQRTRLATVSVEGRSIDCLNLASLHRRLNRSLAIQRAEHIATIRGEDLTITWHYTGYCRADLESTIEFSIDADSHVPFDELMCVGYDLLHDRQKRHAIHPLLIGDDGISKKVAVPFLAAITSGESFDMMLTCVLPGCMKSGIEYCTATVSFEQELIPHYSTRLIFDQDRPEWVRVYECSAAGDTRLLNEIGPAKISTGGSEYLDQANNMSARSAKIYVFRRSLHGVRGVERGGRAA